MRAGKGAQHRNPPEIERCGVGRQITLVLQAQRQPEPGVGLFDEVGPDRARADALEHDAFLQPTDHVHVQVGGRSRRGRLSGVVVKRAGKMARSQQPHLFPGPGGEYHIPLQRESSPSLLGGQMLGDFEQAGNARGVIVSPVMDGPFFLAAGQRGGAVSPAEMVDMRPNHQRPGPGRPVRRQTGQDVPPGFFLLSNIYAGSQPQPGQRKPRDRPARIRSVVQRREVFAAGLQPGGRDRIGDRQHPNTRPGQRGVKGQADELIVDRGVGSADDNETPRAMIAGDHSLATQAGVALEMGAPLLGDVFRQIAEDQHPVVRHIEMSVRVISRLTVGRRRGNTIAGEHDSRRLEPAGFGKGQRTPVSVDHIGRSGLRCGPTVSGWKLAQQGVVWPERDASRKRKGLEVGAVITRRSQPKALKQSGHVGCRGALTGRTGQPAGHLFRG